MEGGSPANAVGAPFLVLLPFDVPDLHRAALDELHTLAVLVHAERGAMVMPLNRHGLRLKRDFRVGDLRLRHRSFEIVYD